MARHTHVYWLRQHAHHELGADELRSAGDEDLARFSSARLVEPISAAKPKSLFSREYGPEIAALGLFLGDLLTLLLAASLTDFFVSIVNPQYLEFSSSDISTLLLIFSVVVTAFALISLGTYRIREAPGNAISAIRPTAAASIGVLGGLAVLFFVNAGNLYNVETIIAFGMLAAAIMSAGRLGFRGRISHFIDLMRSRNAVMCGDFECIQRCAENLKLLDKNVKVVGFIDGFDEAFFDPRGAGFGTVPRFASFGDLRAQVWRNEVDTVIIALPAGRQHDLPSLVDKFAALNIAVHIANDVPTLAGHVGPCAAPPTICVVREPISGWSALGKRMFDLVGACLLLLLTLPVLLVAAVAIMIETPGGAFFRQERVGYRDARFRIWKFRSMHLAPSTADVRGGVRQATRRDSRVTRVGAFLRRTSIDELPQLINVLCGDMSLVGPRPHAPMTLAGGVPFEDLVECYSMRHRVRPGLTGLAQVRGLRGQTDTEAQVRDRVSSDLEYIRVWSLGLDVRILIKTVVVVMEMRNAH